jgi:hypothetical protein
LKAWWSVLITVKFTIRPRPPKDWKNFRLHGCRIRHILHTSRLAISGFSARTRMRCPVSGFRPRTMFKLSC